MVNPEIRQAVMVGLQPPPRQRLAAVDKKCHQALAAQGTADDLITEKLGAVGVQTLEDRDQ